MNSVLGMLWEVSIQAGVLVAILAMLRLLFIRRINPRILYTLWSIVWLRLLIPVSIPSGISVMNTVEPITQHIERVFVNDAAVQGMAAYIPMQSASQAASFSWSTLLFAVWLAGTLIILLLMIYTNRRFSRFAKRHRTDIDVDEVLLPLCTTLGLRAKPKVYMCENIASPCVAGLFKPRIYLNPVAMQSQSTLRYVLTHELYHIKHWDHIWILLRNIACVIYWFHPLVWLAGYLSHRDCELACDASVLSGLDSAQGREYGMVLLSILSTDTAPLTAIQTSATLTMGKKEMKERMIMIVEKRRRSAIVALMVVILAVGTALAACTGPDNKEVNFEQDMTASPLPSLLAHEANEPLDNIPAIISTEPVVDTVQMLSAPVYDKVCLAVNTTERPNETSYYVFSDEVQETLIPWLEKLEYGEPDKGIYNGRNSMGISIAYKGMNWEALSDNSFYHMAVGEEDKNYWVKDKALLNEVLTAAAREVDVVPYRSLEGILSAEMRFAFMHEPDKVYTQTVTDKQALAEMERLFMKAVPVNGGSGCPFGEALLTLTLADGSKVKLALASDSCCIFFIDGLYFGFKESDNTFNEIIYNYFPDIPIFERHERFAS